MKYTLKIIVATSLFFMVTIMPKKVFATPISASSAAFITNYEPVKTDNRVRILKDYLIKQNSPLVDSAKTFVEEADKNKLDWKLVVSISGLESSFGKRIPVNSYNGWGWGVYGNNVIRFSSWDEAIRTVSRGLRENYMNKWGAKDIYSIGRIYAASPTWAQRVIYFMNNLEKFERNWTDTSLSLSL